MATGNSMLVAFGILVAAATGAALDMRHDVAETLVIYTTPALRDVLEKSILPSWEKAGGRPVDLIYLAAGGEYNRLRMSPTRPEADLFLHASPLYLEKGSAEGLFAPLAGVEAAPREYLSADTREWVAFAWSPIVEVYRPALGATPDLATSELRYGLAHPTLSNNGIYTALIFEAVSPAAGAHALERTIVQPVNARANILGVADSSFDLTLGYEAVALYYQTRGAAIAIDVPVIDGQRIHAKALFAASVVRNGAEADAQAFVQHMLGPEVQADLANFHLRSTTEPDGSPQGRIVTFDWTQWQDIEAILPRYEVANG